MECFVSCFITDMRRGVGALCCLMCAGPVLFIIGISILLSAPFNDTRDNNLKDMNAAVDLWNSQYYSQFNKIDAFVVNANTNANTTLFRDTPTYTTEITDNDGVHSYTAVYYDNNGNGYIASTPYSDNAVATVTFKVTENGQTDTFTASMKLFKSTSTAYTGSSTTGSSSSGSSSTFQANCLNDGGKYSNNVCTRYYAATNFCVKIRKAGTWGTDNTYGGIGCKYNDGTWDAPSAYKLLSYDNGNVFTTNVNFDGSEYTLRSRYDPYIDAQYITEGTMDFGASKAQIAGTGLVIMIIGIIFMVPCAIFAALFAVALRRRN